MATKEKGYIEAVGRRKTSIARVRIVPAAKTTMIVNNRDVATYFPTAELRNTAHSAFAKSATTQKFAVTVVLKGGGITSQSEALRHGIARALTEYDLELRKALKKEGYLKRDPRMKERRKFGLKKARKAAQWSKR